MYSPDSLERISRCCEPAVLRAVVTFRYLDQYLRVQDPLGDGVPPGVAVAAAAT